MFSNKPLSEEEKASIRKEGTFMNKVVVVIAVLLTLLLIAYAAGFIPR
jgi:hypothetical protein